MWQLFIKLSETKAITCKKLVAFVLMHRLSEDGALFIKLFQEVGGNNANDTNV